MKNKISNFLGLKLKGGLGTGTLYLILLMILIGFAGIQLTNGLVPTRLPKNTGTAVTPKLETTYPDPGKKRLQLYTFGYTTAAPTAPPVPQGNLCAGDAFNEEPDIFRGSVPPAGGVVTAGGQIKVWIDDGNGGSMAPGEKVDPTTGRITTPGDRTSSDGKGANYYLWEPAIYLTKLTSPSQPGPYSGDAENGGTPNFPIAIKGEVSYGDGGNKNGFVKGLPPIDPVENIRGGRSGHGGSIGQYIWDVNSLGLSTGYYRVQIVTHDGDGDLAIDCSTIQI
ncbi:MAG TPA: hypothetical protein VNA13_03520 [Xanthomonadales bacterium]|nr:hypothetical protein [Xanthomonadales bacterium]